MVTPYYPPSTGGMERFVQKLTEKLRERGVSVRVITGSHFGRTTEPALQLKTKLVVLGNPVIPSLLDALRSDGFDLIHAHDEHALSTNTAAFGSRITGKPLVVHGHGSFTGGGLPWRLFVRMYMSTLGRYTLQAAASTVALCPTEAKELSKFGARNVRVIPNAVEPEELDLSVGPDIFVEHYGLSGKRIVLFVGRMIPLKGVLMIPRIAELLSEREDLVFAAVGDGPLRPRLAAEVKKRRLRNVLVTGRLERRMLFSAYKAADSVLVPSVSEGLPSVVLEAGLLCKPVIASDLPNIRDYFAATCSLAPPGDAGHFARLVKVTLAAPPDDHKLEETRELILKEFTWRRVTEDVMSLYKETVSRRVN